MTLRALLHEPDAASKLKARLSADRRSKTSRTFSHRNVTCGGLNFGATRLHEAQIFICDSWFDYIVNVPSLGDDWVNVDRVIDRKTARKLRRLAAQTGASVVTVLERSIELFFAADEAKAKVIPFPNRLRVPS
jgi:hypothetical protein